MPWRFCFILAGTACLAIVGIGARSQLGYYIHPRYNLFTVSLSLIGGLLLLHAAVKYKYTGQTNITYRNTLELIYIFTKWLLGKGSWFVLIVTILLIWSPAKPLLSRAAERKERETTATSEFIYQAEWFDNPKTMYQLQTVLNTPRGQTEMEGKEFEFVGFVRADKAGNPDLFNLSRFTISCCAVDASPSSILVYQQGWLSDYPIDSWVRVKGKLKTINVGGKPIQALTEASVESISQPKEPYEFLAF